LAADASAKCVCNADSHDYSGITVEGNCVEMCKTWGGVAQWEEPTTQYNSCTCNGMTFQTAKTCDEACPASESGTQVNETLNKAPTQVNQTQNAPSGGVGNVVMPNFMGVKSVSDLILKVVKFLITLAIPFAVMMLIWAGFLFATAQGSEDKINKAKRNLIWTIVGIAVILASEAIVDYVTEILGGSGSGQASDLLEKIKDTLNEIIVLLFVLVTVYFAWGVIKYVRAGGDEKALTEGKRHMIWGIIGMAIMAGAWGIVEMIQLYFGL